MTPENSRMLLNAYIDGELDVASTIEVESEIEQSPALRQEVERLSAMQDLVQSRATRFNAPSHLRTSLVAASHDAAAESSGVSAWWRTIAIGASASAAAAVALLLWSLGSTFLDQQTHSILIDEVVSAHLRSLMSDHLTDLASSERHSVKPWLSHRLHFAPPVHELERDGFILLGARLDYVGGKPTAAIVYRQRQHLINVFIHPAEARSEGSIKLSSQRGYNSVTFGFAGMSYWLVSDLNQNDLVQLAKLLQQPAT